MTITVRKTRHGGTIVRLTGAHARVFTGLLLDLIEAEPTAAAITPAPLRPVSQPQALGADSASEGPQSS